MSGDLAGLAASWVAAAREERIAAALEAVYAGVARDVEVRGPVCWASGRCCNFERAGHRLYVTGLEAAYTAVRAVRAIDGNRGPWPLTVLDVDRARTGGGCPYQEGNLCGAHAARPLGCRVYFCDRSAQAWQHGLSERAMAEVRALHDGHGVAYRYGEWRGMLEAVAPLVSA